MAYKDKNKQREYQHRWYLENIVPRRLEWLGENGPCVDCDSWDDLEVDHVDARKKISHNVWGWSKARREKELAKCVARCHDCHARKTTLSGEHASRERNGKSKLTSEQVNDIRQRFTSGESAEHLATAFGIHKAHLYNITNGRYWKH